MLIKLVQDPYDIVSMFDHNISLIKMNTIRDNTLHELLEIKNIDLSNNAAVCTEYVYGGVISSIGEMIKNAIQKIIDYTKYIVRFISDTVKYIANFDKGLVVLTNAKQNTIVDWLVSASSSKKNELNDELSKTSIKRMVKFEAFQKLLATYEKYNELLFGTVFSSILRDVRSIENESSTEEIIPWITDKNIKELGELGILIIKPRYSVKTKSPFNLNSDTQTLKELGFDKYDSILSISKHFAKKSYPTFSKFKSSTFQINSILLELDKQKRYFTNNNTINKEICFKNIKRVHRQLSVWTALFNSLKTITFAFNFRRQALLNCLLRAIEHMKSPSDI